MSITPDPVPNPAAPTPPAPEKKPSAFSLLTVVLLTLPVALVGGAVYAYYYYGEYKKVAPVDFIKSIRVAVSNPEKLDEGFVDADGDLVADVPTDAAKLQKPDTLLFGTLETDPKKAAAEWKEFIDHLAKTTGKKVELVETPPGGLGIVEHLKGRKLHIATLSTGTVPRAVNTAGFVPCFVMADENGKWAYEMEILVPAESGAKSPTDLKGKTLTATSMSSLSGFKAPIVTLYREFKFTPDVDVMIRVGAGQRENIKDLVAGKAEAISVANDYLARVVRDEKIDRSVFRSVYKSKSYPPACFGHVHDLDPATAALVRKAYETFEWKGTALEKAYRAANQSKFVPISYKKDFASVREIDKSVLEMCEGK